MGTNNCWIKNIFFIIEIAFFEIHCWMYTKLLDLNGLVLYISIYCHLVQMAKKMMRWRDLDDLIKVTNQSQLKIVLHFWTPVLVKTMLALFFKIFIMFDFCWQPLPLSIIIVRKQGITSSLIYLYYAFQSWEDFNRRFLDLVVFIKVNIHPQKWLNAKILDTVPEKNKMPRS